MKTVFAIMIAVLICFAFPAQSAEKSEDTPQQQVEELLKTCPQGDSVPLQEMSKPFASLKNTAIEEAFAEFATAVKTEQDKIIPLMRRELEELCKKINISKRKRKSKKKKKAEERQLASIERLVQNLSFMVKGHHYISNGVKYPMSPLCLDDMALTPYVSVRFIDPSEELERTTQEMNTRIIALSDKYLTVLKEEAENYKKDREHDKERTKFRKVIREIIRIKGLTRFEPIGTWKGPVTLEFGKNSEKLETFPDNKNMLNLNLYPNGTWDCIHEYPHGLRKGKKGTWSYDPIEMTVTLIDKSQDDQQVLSVKMSVVSANLLKLPYKEVKKNKRKKDTLNASCYVRCQQYDNAVLYMLSNKYFHVYDEYDLSEISPKLQADDSEEEN